MEEKKRKSSRSFDLEKGGKRSFDLQKTSTHKFDLSKNSDEVSLEELKKELLVDGIIDAEEVTKLREVLYADGKIDQDEADFVFELNDAVSGKDNSPMWNEFFVQTISDYLLNDEKSPGVIDEEEGKWLIEKIGSDGQVDGAEKQLLSHLNKNAKKIPASVKGLIAGVPTTNNTTSEVIDFQKLKKEILADGKIDKDEVSRLRQILYADGKIDQEEADFLFELNDAVSGKANDPSWKTFFVKAISDYLLNDEQSPGVIDEEEGKWLEKKINGDGKLDSVERVLAVSLLNGAKSMPQRLKKILAQAKTDGSLSNTEKQGGTHLEEPVQQESERQSSGKGKKWLAAALVIAALAGGGYYLFNNQKTEAEKVPAQQVALNGDATDSEGSSAFVEENTGKAVEDNEGGDVDVVEDLGQGVEEPDVAENRAESQKGDVTENRAVSQEDDNTGSDKKTENQKNDVAQNNSASQSVAQKQNSVNQSGLQSLASTLEEQAYQVIRGEFGNNPERAQRLGEAYRQIQDKVNELYRNGLVN